MRKGEQALKRAIREMLDTGWSVADVIDTVADTFDERLLGIGKYRRRTKEQMMNMETAHRVLSRLTEQLEPVDE